MEHLASLGGKEGTMWPFRDQKPTGPGLNWEAKPCAHQIELSPSLPTPKAFEPLASGLI